MSQVSASRASADVARIFLEKIDGHGEDAEPVAMTPATLGAAWRLIAVCDGLGGSGSAHHQWFDQERTGAYIGARIAARFVEREAPRLLAEALGPAGAETIDDGWEARFGAGCEDGMRAAFRAGVREFPQIESGMISTMSRLLPTTLAMAAAQDRGESLAIAAYWAGDSRIYAFSAAHGLQLLTFDHVDPADARSDAQIQIFAREAMDPAGGYVDAPMSGALSANARPRLRLARHRFDRAAEQPLALIAMTDGVYATAGGAFALEREIAAHLAAAESAEAFSHGYGEALFHRMNDDVSMALFPTAPWSEVRRGAAEIAARREQEPLVDPLATLRAPLEEGASPVPTIPPHVAPQPGVATPPPPPRPSGSDRALARLGFLFAALALALSSLLTWDRLDPEFDLAQSAKALSASIEAYLADAPEADAPEDVETEADASADREDAPAPNE